MAKRPKHPTLKYVKWTFSKGRWYGYFDTGKLKVNGQPIFAPLPPVGSFGFMDSYAAMVGHRNRKSDEYMTVAGLIERYKESDSFKKRAKGTQRAYSGTMRRIETLMGEFPIDEVTRAEIRFALSNKIDGDAAKNLFKAVVGVLYRYARDNEWTTADPTKDIPKYKTGEYEPWPKELLEAALGSKDRLVRLAVHLLYYTGQRFTDARKMAWSQIIGANIKVVQQKTSKPLMIHIHEKLAAELAVTPRRCQTIQANDLGKPLGEDKLREAIRAFIAEQGYDPEIYKPHGLRKNAVNSLLEAGCTHKEVQSVTGQSIEVIEHYAKRVDQAHLSKAAVLKFERGAA